MIWVNHWAVWLSPSLQLHAGGYLSPNTREPLIAGLWYFLECNMLVLFSKAQFVIFIQDSQPAWIWNQISGTKSSYTNHWATLHWLKRKYFVSFQINKVSLRCKNILSVFFILFILLQKYVYNLLYAQNT